MTVLVTGATGFFGPGIVSRLRAAGHTVIGASRTSGDDEQSRTLDVTSYKSCERVFESIGPVDVVVHAAALAHVKPTRVSEHAAYLVNTVGTENVLKAAIRNRVPKFVFVSSVMVYGDFDLPDVVTEDHPCLAQGMYGRAKTLAENACFAARDSISPYIMRMGTMYSPEWLTNIRKRVRPLAHGRPLYFRLDPFRRRYSLCSRANGAEAILWAVERRIPADTYNVTDQYVYRQEDILEAVEGFDGKGWHIPVPLIVPKLAWWAVRSWIPIHKWRESAHSRYWKFCEYNVYSSQRLSRFGLSMPPDLLRLRSVG